VSLVTGVLVGILVALVVADVLLYRLLRGARRSFEWTRSHHKVS